MEQTTLHRITGRAQFCGPTAISALAGVKSCSAAAVIRHMFDRKRVTGTAPAELVVAMKWWDYEVVEWMAAPKYRLFGIEHPQGTLYRHASDTVRKLPATIRGKSLGKLLAERPSGLWAIAASNHWIAFADGQVADSGHWFGRKPVEWDISNPACDSVRLKRLKYGFRFSKKGG